MTAQRDEPSWHRQRRQSPCRACWLSMSSGRIAVVTVMRSVENADGRPGPNQPRSGSPGSGSPIHLGLLIRSASTSDCRR